MNTTQAIVKELEVSTEHIPPHMYARRHYIDYQLQYAIIRER